MAIAGDKSEHKKMNPNKTKLEKAFEEIGFEPVLGRLYDIELIAKDYTESIDDPETMPLPTCFRERLYRVNR